MKIFKKPAYLITTMLICSVSERAVADEQVASDNIINYEILAKKLDDARNSLQPSTGSSVYNFSQENIQNLPLSDDNQFSSLLLQAPGVAQDSYGQLHVRGDHADIQYRLNGIILPEGIAGFGQTLDPHFIDKANFMTGALPAQYGYRTAGIVDITTKSAEVENGGLSSVTAGSNQTLEVNQQLYGSQGRLSYYFSGTYNQNDRGIEPPTSGAKAIHDNTQQDKEFAYMSYVISPEKRLSLILGNATSRFEIPNNPGQPQIYNLTGTPDYPSGNLNETQFEHNTYGILAYQGVINDQADYQFALFSRASSLLYKPDPLGDLIYNGVAARVYQGSITNGLQNDYSYRYNDNNTIRSGFSASYETAKSDNDSSVFLTADNCTSASCAPFSIIDDHSKDATLLGYYLQDEWQAVDKLAINYGARFDYYDAYVSEVQLSPRIGAIYDLTSDTKLHIGYAHYFTPPPTELIAPVTVAAFQDTTGASASQGASPVKPERDNYFDAGVIQKLGSNLTLGVDSYYKKAHDLLDLGQFGQALVFAPFNYAEGYVKGVEFTGDYIKGDFSAYSNLAISQAEGKDIVSGQYNFAPDELNYIASNYVHLDHDQKFTGSAGASYKFYTVKYSADMLYGSGLRDGDDNTGHLPFYTQFNTGAEHIFNTAATGSFDAKLSVINVFDRIYEIRDGSGIGVFAPQYGPRRGFFISLSKAF